MIATTVEREQWTDRKAESGSNVREAKILAIDDEMKGFKICLLKKDF